MTCLTFNQLIQAALELELEINKTNKQSTDIRVQRALEKASEQIPDILEWIRTARNCEKKGS